MSLIVRFHPKAIPFEGDVGAAASKVRIKEEHVFLQNSYHVSINLRHVQNHPQDRWNVEQGQNYLATPTTASPTLTHKSKRSQAAAAAATGSLVVDCFYLTVDLLHIRGG